MIIAHADWMEAEGLRGLLDVLGAGEGETRFVGGCVRDTILGLPVSDIDLATRLAPQEVLRRLRGAGIRAVPTGLAHGTVTAVLPSGPVEVTTLRRDVATDGRHAVIAYTDDWCQDAARRDFTINALSVEPVTLEGHDYFGGFADLDARLVRFIGDPFTRIAEDHLRILRFFRFHARFGMGDPDRPALAACTARANDLMALSRERIADELVKLLALPAPASSVRLMVENDILRAVLPEIGPERLPALDALIDAEAVAGIAPDPLRRLVSLLPADPMLAAGVAARLRLSNKAQKRIAAAAGRAGPDTGRPDQLAYAHGTETAIDRLLLTGRPSDAASLKDWEKPRLTLGGGDLIAMGLSPGPLVARTLQAVERAWSAEGFPEDEDRQRAIARAIVDQALLANQ